MTDRIKAIRKRLMDKEYRKLRTDEKWDKGAEFEAEGLSRVWRSARLLRFLVETETPVLFDGDRIGFYRTIKNIPMPLSRSEQEIRLKTKFVFEDGGVGNISSDYEDVISRGFEAKRKDILRSREKFTKGSDEYEQLSAMADCIDSVYLLADKYRAKAQEIGCVELYGALGNIPRKGAASYYEALVFLRLINFTLWLNSNKHITVGRYDKYMRPYYEKDIKAGVMTRDEAMELTEEFFLSLNFDADLYPGIQQGDNGQSLMLGGVDKDGNSVYSDLSRLCLEASLELNVIDPKINVRVDKNTPDDLYKLGTLLTKQGLGFPQYSNDDVVIPALVKLGYELEDARDYTVAACWEFIIPGKGMDVPNIGSLGYPELINKALEKATDDSSFEEILALVRNEIKIEVTRIINKIGPFDMNPSPYQSILMDGCIENGKDISVGGVYNNYGIHGTGLSSAADALASVKQNVFDQKNFSLSQLKNAMNANFNGYEKMRLQCLGAPKMGNNDDYADELGSLLLEYFADECDSHINNRGGCFRAGTGSAMNYIWQSEALGATADGRKAGEPFSANYSPALGIENAGVLSVIQSFTKPDLVRTCNGGPLTLEFHDTVFRNEQGIEKVAMLVKTFVLKGGHQLQLNAVSRDTLLDAKAHPENHTNLIVRVWGWSGYFNELAPVYQDHVIRRYEFSV